MFFKQKKLFEEDPETLSLELLSRLQASLIAKLILVHSEMEKRYRNLVSLSEGLPASDAPQTTLLRSADHLEQLNTILSAELSRISGSSK